MSSCLSQHQLGSVLLCSGFWRLISPLPVLFCGDQLRKNWIWSILGHFGNFYKGLSSQSKYRKCTSIASYLNGQPHTVRSSADLLYQLHESSLMGPSQTFPVTLPFCIIALKSVLIKKQVLATSK